MNGFISHFQNKLQTFDPQANCWLCRVDSFREGGQQFLLLIVLKPGRMILQVIRSHHEWISSSALHPSYWQTHYPKWNRKNSNILIFFIKYHLLKVKVFSNSTFIKIVFCCNSTVWSHLNSHWVVCDPWSKSQSELYCHLSHVNVCKETNYKAPGLHIVQMAGYCTLT